MPRWLERFSLRRQQQGLHSLGRRCFSSWQKSFGPYLAGAAFGCTPAGAAFGCTPCRWPCWPCQTWSIVDCRSCCPSTARWHPRGAVRRPPPLRHPRLRRRRWLLLRRWHWLLPRRHWLLLGHWLPPRHWLLRHQLLRHRLLRHWLLLRRHRLLLRHWLLPPLMPPSLCSSVARSCTGSFVGGRSGGSVRQAQIVPI